LPTAPPTVPLIKGRPVTTPTTVESTVAMICVVVVGIVEVDKVVAIEVVFAVDVAVDTVVDVVFAVDVAVDTVVDEVFAVVDVVFAVVDVVVTAETAKPKLKRIITRGAENFILNE